MSCKKGDWVQIKTVILPVGQRAPQVPPETQEVPLFMFAKGFASRDAEFGEQIGITTIIGRQLEGELVALNPRYDHDFGAPVPELLTIGMELRKKLQDGRHDQ